MRNHYRDSLEATIHDMEVEIAELDNMIKVMEAIGNEESTSYYRGRQRTYEDIVAKLEKEIQWSDVYSQEDIMNPGLAEDFVFSEN